MLDESCNSRVLDGQNIRAISKVLGKTRVAPPEASHSRIPSSHHSIVFVENLLMLMH